MKLVNQSPILICGCHGGGTSYTTKLLRWMGFFPGADVTCKIDERTTHESKIFQITNEMLLQHVMPGCPRGLRTNEEYWFENWNRAIAASSTVAELRSRIDIDSVMNSYFGTLESLESIKFWGWKDPRNSLTLPIWKDYFPNMKVLVVQKLHEKVHGNSSSGSWFKQYSSEKIRNIYMNPNIDGIKEGSVFYLNFNKVVTDLNYFNSFCYWLGLPELSMILYQKLLSDTGYEP